MFNDNIVSQIKPIEYGAGYNELNNNVIKEEDSLEQEDGNNIVDKGNDEINHFKEEREIMKQMEDEMNVTMNQMNELAGNLKIDKKNKNSKQNNKKMI